MEILLQAIKRVERKLDTVIRAIYEHDEGITDEYGRSQRVIEAGRSNESKSEAGGVLGQYNESSPGAPSVKRKPSGYANPTTNHGEVQREESIPSSNREGENVPRKGKGKRKYYHKRNGK